ncbi:MAG: hypothetical protein JSR39_09480 [Verrucomicrobia bacterium]|nr:hypothetical protein [Verrucomicrobiota bacterium]
MAASSTSSENDSSKYLTKMAAMDWAPMARKHPSRSNPGLIDEAKLEKIYRKMDAALQGYFNEPGRAGSDSLDGLSMQALFNFGRACHFTNANGAIGENISLFLRKWGALSPSQSDSEGRKGIVIGGKWLSQGGGLKAAPYSASARVAITVGDIVVVGYPSDKDKRYGRVREGNLSYVTIDIGEQIPIRQSKDKLHLLEQQPPVIERRHPEMHAFLITEPTFNEDAHPDFGEGAGCRTITMFNFMDGFKRNFHRSPRYEAQLKVDEVIYTPATGGLLSLSQRPVVSCGSSSGREVIALNPKNSPLLNAHYNHIVAYLKSQAGHLSEREVLTYVKDYIRNYMLFRSTEPDLVRLTDQLVADFRRERPAQSLDYEQSNYWSRGTTTVQVPFIPIDHFIEKGIGVCRHHALIAAYILDRLTYEEPPLLKGAAQHMRDNIPFGAHVWTTFINESGAKWHIDTLWDRIEDFSDPVKLQELALPFAYGGDAMRNQVRRTGSALASYQAHRRANPKPLLEPVGGGAMANPFMGALVRLHRLVADGASVTEMRKEMKKLSDEDRINIHYHVWELHGKPIDPSDHDWGNTHLFDSIPIFDQAVQQALKAKFNGIPKDQQNQIFGEVFRLAGSPHSDDPVWGENHAFDDIPRLATAMAIVLQ